MKNSSDTSANTPATNKKVNGQGEEKKDEFWTPMVIAGISSTGVVVLGVLVVVAIIVRHKSKNAQMS
jgi:hypothetical protein